jgi:hypothetical protein
MPSAQKRRLLSFMNLLSAAKGPWNEYVFVKKCDEAVVGDRVGLNGMCKRATIKVVACSLLDK